MKHFLLIFFLMMSEVCTYAQDTDVEPSTNKSIGLRLGNATYEYRSGSSVEVSYQQEIRNGLNRVEVDLGFNYGFKITGIYQWVWDITDDLNWYVGPAASIVFSGFEESAGVGVLVGLQGGIEYEFTLGTLPLQASLDLRPLWSLVSVNVGYADPSLGLGIRYRF